MKNRKYIYKACIAVITTALFTFSSCTKLDEKVYDSTTPDNYYQTKDQVLSGYVMPYAFIQTHIYQVHFALQEFVTDEAVAPVRGGYVDQNGAWNRFHRHTWTSAEPWIELEWNDMYQAIGFCNAFIDAITNKDISGMGLEISKEQMIAEIKLVRALHYYWAWSDFGNIPVVEHVGEQSPATKSAAEVFSWIEKEIKDNIPLLGDKGDPLWYGHFTKNAARALLAKLYLNAEAVMGTAHWDDCIEQCNAIINSGEYTLDEAWNTPFLVHNESSQENIFVVPFDANRAQQFNAAQQQLHWSLAPVKYGLEDAWYKTVTEESFFNLFQDNDFRKQQWLYGPQFYTDENGEEQPVYDGEEQLVLNPHIEALENFEGGWTDGVVNIKYEVEYSTLPNMSNDLVVFRLSDIMFMKAESLMRKNGGSATSEAVNLINDVRARSFEAGDPDATYTTGTLTLDELLNERGREFAYEMYRREDLIRFGHFNDEWWEKPASQPFRKFFPIPFNAITANPALKQNPGYN
ncbi:RagB/SusD family nutrient uptake outer membrane protein [Mucilaginibacter limnophilus]|uniref:RagB/SusD family nutrient uptake outer membrane protein n=1 Tax=Mucilaginibacter limnophilus TaxID=1932778 RepID=A0A437MZG5_9SPHI|nr:RagB/SusD family nutrient uptake outer membrane protein [Mucilaginibacter limnophilus]RVU03047.1 RagB/SusD family nutrient uptake outer membrane protein [Mucilaginibacter limnophilus]